MEPIRTDRLTRRYVMGESVVTALDGVSLEIGERESVAILGRSGSGKSTLLNLLGGLDRPTAGEVHVGTRRLAELSDDELAEYRRTGVGLIFQFFNLVPSLCASENIELPLVLAGLPRPERKRRAGELLDRVGLTARSRHRPSELSGGEQQRVAIARALAHDPPLLLADEPTGNLDTRTAGDIIKLLTGLDDRTLIIITHDRTLAEAHTRRIIELGDGKVVADDRA